MGDLQTEDRESNCKNPYPSFHAQRKHSEIPLIVRPDISSLTQSGAYTQNARCERSGDFPTIYGRVACNRHTQAVTVITNSHPHKCENLPRFCWLEVCPSPKTAPRRCPG